MIPVGDAWRLLDLDPTDDGEAVHRAFRSAMQRSHPDVSSGGAGGQDPALLTEAYRVLRAEIASGSASPRSAPPVPDDDEPPSSNPQRSPAAGRQAFEEWAAWTEVAATPVRQAADDTLSVGAPPDETFRMAVDALHSIGDLTYLDRSSALAQAIVTFEDGPYCYVHISLQGRAPTGATDVFVTIESLDSRPPPPIDAVTALLTEAVGRSFERRPVDEGR